MSTEGEQQGAVCGTCGHIAYWHGENLSPDGQACAECIGTKVHPQHPFIPAPVVPSDDECTDCGHYVEAHGTSRYCYECPKDEDGTALHEFKPRMTTPPTPSQDAEGDGRWNKRDINDPSVPLDSYVYTAAQLSCEQPGEGATDAEWDEYWARVRAVMEGYANYRDQFESAIREPYEALVKAADGAKEAFWGMFGVTGLPSSVLSKMRALDAALTRIEESLGGRS